MEQFSDANLVTETNEPHQIDWQERMVVMEQYGFLPTSSDELNRAMVVLDYLGTRRKVGGHLNEIVLHNKRYASENPAAAAMSVVRGFEYWARDAIGQVASYQKLCSKLALVNPAENALVIYETEEPEDADDIFVSLTALIKQDRLQRAVAVGNREILATTLAKSDGGKKQKEVKSTTNTVTDDEKKTFLNSHTALDLRKLAEAQTGQQSNRFAFWREVIAQSDNHMAVTAMVKHILPKLDKKAKQVIQK